MLFTQASHNRRNNKLSIDILKYNTQKHEPITREKVKLNICCGNFYANILLDAVISTSFFIILWFTMTLVLLFGQNINKKA